MAALHGDPTVDAELDEDKSATDTHGSLLLPATPMNRLERHAPHVCATVLQGLLFNTPQTGELLQFTALRAEPMVASTRLVAPTFPALLEN